MFTSYVKSLNDMVFSTSESPKPEESPTGVLGRIGSWFSPWRAQNPRDPEDENAPPAEEQRTPGPGAGSVRERRGEEESPEPVREPWASWQQEDETDARSSDLERWRLSRDIFPDSEKEDAAESAHEDGPFVSTDWQPAERGPREEEEFLDAQEEFQEGRRGRARERAGSGGGSGDRSPVSGDPASGKNASYLTQGAAGRAEGVLHTQAQRKAHAQTGKKLHVYLEEEASVIKRGNDTCAGQEVVCTRLEKVFHVISKTKSLDAIDLPRNDDRKQPEIRTPPRSAHGRLSAPVELATLSDRSGSEPEEAQSDTMVRKNVSRRKPRKLSQGEAESSPLESTPSKAEGVTGSPSPSGGVMTGPQAPGVETHLGEAAGNSASTQCLSEGGKNKTLPAAIQREIPPGKQSKGYRGEARTRPTDTTGAGVDGDMEEEDKLERKTETPESKRRSMKVSRSEVKIFPKKVFINAEPQSGQPGSGNAAQNLRSGLIKPKDAVKDHSKTEVFTGKPKLDEEPKPVIAGRIADRINIFEGQRVGAVKKTFHGPRSADVSPARAAARAATEADVGDGGLRSRSAERLLDPQFSSAPPAKEQAKTVKERARNIDACKTDGKAPASPKLAMAGMSLKTSSSVTQRAASKPSQPDIQDKPALGQKKPGAFVTEIRSERDEPDGAIDVSGPERPQTDPRTEHPEKAPEGTDPLTAPAGAGSDRPGPGSDYQGQANEISQEAETPSRTGARSKKRRSREPACPTDVIKAEGSSDQPPPTSSQQEKAPATSAAALATPALAPTDMAGKVQAHKSLGNTSVDEKHSATDSTPQASDGDDGKAAAGRIGGDMLNSEPRQSAAVTEVSAPQRTVETPTVVTEAQPAASVVTHTTTTARASDSDKTTVNVVHAAGATRDAAQSSPAVNITHTAATETSDKQKDPGSDPRSPVVNGDIHPQPRPINDKPGQAAPAPDSATPSPGKENNNNTTTEGSPLRSPRTRLTSPRGLSGGNLSPQRDAPSSWLDVDVPKQRLRLPELPPRLCSSSSESNLLDTAGDLDDDDFVEKIKNLCAPFSMPPRKHSFLRQPQPPFAMPAIREARFEKTFDPDEFKFGLSKKSQKMGPSLLANRQSAETKANLKPARASLVDRGKRPALDVLSLSGVASPSNASHTCPSPGGSPPDMPSPTSPAPLAGTLYSHAPAALAGSGEALNGEAVVSESVPPLPSFNDVKLPDVLEKYLPREPEKPELSKAGKEQVNTEKPGVRTTLDVAAKKMNEKPGGTPPRSPVTVTMPIPAPKPPSKLAPPAREPLPLPLIHPSQMEPPKGPHRRPGKMVLFESAPCGGQAHEVLRDVADATALQFSPLISVRVVRGCWILYENPGFQGRSIALEEGCLELTNVWAAPNTGPGPHKDPAVLIGSIRLAVCDYVLPYIDLFAEPEGRGRLTAYHDDTVETGSFGVSPSTGSIKVHAGVWLVFSDPGYQGMLAVLEAGEYPFPESWGFPSPFIGSLRPLKMGALKVENPNEVKAVLYQSPGFEGPSVEIDSDLFCFDEEEEENEDEVEQEDKTLKSVGSLKIIGGLWVGYSHPGFEGRQHVLEEGEYQDWGDWGGGSEHFLSLRPVLADFMSPHLKMFSDLDFGTLGANIDLTVPVPSVEDTGFGLRTQSVDVQSGVWVVFEEPDFCGEAYVLEKGLYGSPEDWGALKHTVASVMPIMLENVENSAKFKVQLFSEAGFQGSQVVLEDSVEALQPDFSVSSCRVLAGSWLAFEGAGFAGRMYVLEVGGYSDLRAMGCLCADTGILSLQTTGFEFSLPSVTLFERSALRGKRVLLTAGTVNLQLAGACSRSQSLVVEGGMWVLYEEINYRGHQILLRPGDIPDWRGFSGWPKIGSLRPLIQKQVYIRLRNRETGLLMAVTGQLEDIKLMRVQGTEETDGVEQIWLFHEGHLRCKLLEECCLCPSGSMTMAGSRLGLSPEPSGRQHLWSITPDGLVHLVGPSGLLLDIKGGHNYDKSQVILNTYDPKKHSQQWDVEIL
ncbi:hypothetical protein NHX12_026251 [Muraenolepis orangiensis]|uniref:Beta/gamma crystallin 'Greek key' domain-containing protein n=1 Tax=Muraenolepis orangiensis TaxID=630683 RepID=A0A9Q0IN40_9TELE|nr:hypothetical protein NHX12_026251 [Muraenolepis orangiensis]